MRRHHQRRTVVRELDYRMRRPRRGHTAYFTGRILILNQGASAQDGGSCPCQAEQHSENGFGLCLHHRENSALIRARLIPDVGEKNAENASVQRDQTGVDLCGSNY